MLSLFPKNTRGQTSIEIIIIASAIFVLATIILGGFNPTKNSTIALGIVKEKALRALNAGEKNFIIEKIEFQEPSSGVINFSIYTIPNTDIDCIEIPLIQKDDINASGSKAFIEEKGIYNTVSISLNGTEC